MIISIIIYAVTYQQLEIVAMAVRWLTSKVTSMLPPSFVQQLALTLRIPARVMRSSSAPGGGGPSGAGGSGGAGGAPPPGDNNGGGHGGGRGSGRGGGRGNGRGGGRGGGRGNSGGGGNGDPPGDDDGDDTETDDTYEQEEDAEDSDEEIELQPDNGSQLSTPHWQMGVFNNPNPYHPQGQGPPGDDGDDEDEDEDYDEELDDSQNPSSPAHPIYEHDPYDPLHPHFEDSDGYDPYDGPADENLDDQHPLSNPPNPVGPPGGPPGGPPNEPSGGPSNPASSARRASGRKTASLPDDDDVAPNLPPQLLKMVNQPTPFTGIRNWDKVSEAHSWLNKVEWYFKTVKIEKKFWVTVAFNYLESPAFDTLIACKKSLQSDGKWTGTWTQFCEEMMREYSDIEEQFALRTKLSSLKVQNGDVVRYARAFQHTATRIVSPKIEQTALIQQFLSGLDESSHREFLLDPATSRIWTDYHKLYQAVLSKSQITRVHKRFRDNTGDGNRGQYTDGDYKRLNRGGGRGGRGGGGRGYQSSQNSGGGSPYYPPGFDTRRGDRGRGGGRGNGRGGRGGRGGNDRGRGGRFGGRGNQGRGGDRNRNGDRPQGDRDTLDPNKLVVGQFLSKAQKRMLLEQNRCMYCFKVGHKLSDCRSFKADKPK